MRYQIEIKWKNLKLQSLKETLGLPKNVAYPSSGPGNFTLGAESTSFPLAHLDFEKNNHQHF